MGYYKFNPRNHVCSLAWTGFCLWNGFSSGSLLNTIAIPTFLGAPTILVGVNRREQLERQKRKIIVNLIQEKQAVTAGEVANLLNTTGEETRQILSQLYREERIGMSNRAGDMTVVYTSIN